MAPSAMSSTTIPTPSNLTHNTPSLPPRTHAALVNYLKETRSLTELSTVLQDALARSGWTDRVRALALDLIRSGEAVTFPDLLNEVLRRAKVAPAVPEKQKDGAAVETNGGDEKTNGSQTNGAIVVGADWAGPDGKPNVRIPEHAVEVGVEFLREKIKDAVEIVEVDDEA
jgi:hypothetical protein